MKKKEQSKIFTFKTILILILVSIISLLLWARFVSTTGLIIKEYAVINENLPDNFHGIKIVHFTDLHYGTTINQQYVRMLVDTINGLRPDIIVFTGDLFDKDVIKSKDEVLALGYLLSELDAVLGKFAVRGNHDYEKNYFDQAMAVSGFRVLNNEAELIYYRGETPIQIIGLPSLIKEVYTICEDLIADDTIYFRILLAHEPDVIDNLFELNIDLMLAGHSHGGQIRLPFFGAVYTPVGAKNYFNEHYRVGNTDLFISSGIGTSEWRFRFLNRPSINLYRLYSH